MTGSRKYWALEQLAAAAASAGDAQAAKRYLRDADELRYGSRPVATREVTETVVAPPPPSSGGGVPAWVLWALGIVLALVAGVGLGFALDSGGSSGSDTTASVPVHAHATGDDADDAGDRDSAGDDPRHDVGLDRDDHGHHYRDDVVGPDLSGRVHPVRHRHEDHARLEEKQALHVERRAGCAATVASRGRSARASTTTATASRRISRDRPQVAEQRVADVAERRLVDLELARDRALSPLAC